MDRGAMNGACSSSGTEVLDVKPLRSLSPMFPTPFGNTSVSPPGGPPFLCVSPFGPSPSGSHPGHPSAFSPGFPFFGPQPWNAGPANATPEPNHDKGNNNNVPFTAGGAPKDDGSQPSFPGFWTPPPPVGVPLKEDEWSSGGVTSSGGSKVRQLKHASNTEPRSSEGGNSKNKQKRKRVFKANERELVMLPPSSEDPKELVEVILMTFDALRRRMHQLDDASNAKRQSPVMKAGATMMDYDLRANKSKRIGSVPGIEVGDIFYFRIEMLLVGLHAQSMAGIDCMNTKFGEEDDTVAVSVVSSGQYEDETDLVDSLVYSGQGGKASEKQVDDQKLERGNLALERSLHRANVVRVIRGVKDLSVPTGKIYVYDGLYKVRESWKERGKLGFNVFKYKLLRQPGQPHAFAIWKMVEKWKENPSSRGGVILPDISSGEENLPVCLVNEVDTEKGPAPFSYATKVKYLKPMSSVPPLQACHCQNVCLPGDGNCSCALQNGGDLAYTSNELLVSRKPIIYECSTSCWCSGNCRNRVTQKGIKLRFEVFRTRERGWGLRSWDPIRAGSFLCEYVGEIIDKVKIEEDDDEEDEFIFEASNSYEKTFQWNYGPELLGEKSLADLADTPKLPSIIISAKQLGNVARFMNHSCSPNVFWQPVQYDHGDDTCPHIMFFASKHIPPMTELTYDYGLSGRGPKKCLCGSSKCRGIFG